MNRCAVCYQEYDEAYDACPHCARQEGGGFRLESAALIVGIVGGVAGLLGAVAYALLIGYMIGVLGNLSILEGITVETEGVGKLVAPAVWAVAFRAKTSGRLGTRIANCSAWTANVSSVSS